MVISVLAFPQPPGCHQPDGVALRRRVEEDEVRAATGFQPVVPQTKRARSVDRDHVD